jgi:hypothetical protein
VDQPGVEVLGHERVLEALGHPVQGRRDHLGIDVVPDLTALHAELHEVEGPVGVLAPHVAVDRPADVEPGVVPSDQRDPVRDRIGDHEILRALEPPVEHRPEPLVHDLRGRVQPRGEQGDRSLEGLEEQTLLRAEVEEDGALRDADLVGDVLDSGPPVAVLREVPHRGLEDSFATGRRVGHGHRTLAEK